MHNNQTPSRPEWDERLSPRSNQIAQAQYDREKEKRERNVRDTLSGKDAFRGVN